MRDQERSQITPEGARNLIWLLAASLYLGKTRLAESLWMKREIHSTESHLANSIRVSWRIRGIAMAPIKRQGSQGRLTGSLSGKIFRRVEGMVRGRFRQGHFQRRV